MRITTHLVSTGAAHEHPVRSYLGGFGPASRAEIADWEHRPLVFNTKTPHSVCTFLVDGVVAGTWRHEDGQVSVQPFGRLDHSTMRALRAEADQLALLHA